MKIASKISLSFFSVAAILMAGATGAAYLAVSSSLRGLIVADLDSIVHARTDHIETYLKMLERSVKQLSKSQTLEDLMEASKTGDVGNPGLQMATELALKRLVRTKEANPAISEFLLMDEKGKIVASSSDGSVGLDKSMDAIFLGAQKDIYVKDVYYSEELKTPLLAVSAPLLGSSTNRLLGVLAARVRLNDLNKITTDRTGLGEKGEIYIVNKYGFMITPSRFEEGVVLRRRVNSRNAAMAQLYAGKSHVLSAEKGGAFMLIIEAYGFWERTPTYPRCIGVFWVRWMQMRHLPPWPD
jgi:hypothetical protein